MRPTINVPRWRLLKIGLAVLLFTCLLVAADWFRSLKSPSQLPSARAEINGNVLTYLPLLMRDAPPLMTIFGIEADHLTAEGGLYQIDEAGAYWTRRNALEWDLVEPVEGSRNWGALSALESEIIDAHDAGLQVILVMRSTPSWAQAIPPYTCGKILDTKFPAFASFIFDLVSRYSVPPYNVKYWELWNEPDVDPEQVNDPDSAFGCWGDKYDPNFGGDDYADMLAVAYPQIKAADPEAQVIIGGLLLDCDPRIPNACPGPYFDRPSQFLSGILSHHGVNDGKELFDGVAFHAYDYYQGFLGGFGNLNWASSWNTTGPVISAKNSFVQETLSNYGAGGKFIMNTENALICDSCSNDQVYELTKAYYIGQSYAESISVSLKTNIWFSILGWRNSGLVNPDLSPRLGFNAYKTSQNILRNAAYLGPITGADVSDLTGLAGYKFNRSGKMIWVIWSLDGLNHQVSLLNGAPDQAFSVLGQSLPVTQSPIILLEPSFLIWN